MQALRRKMAATIFLPLLLVAGCPTDPGELVDTTPPGEVTDLSADPGDTEVTISWRDPVDSDLEGINVRRTPGDGSVVQLLPGMETAVAPGLENGTEYDFTLSTVDASGNESDGVSVAATPVAAPVDPDPAEPDPDAVYVSVAGIDSANGSLTAPKRTIAAALSLAEAEGKSKVLVSGGIYSESLLLVAGVSLYGGYSSDFSARDPSANVTWITGATPTAGRPATINASGIAGGDLGSTIFDGFVVSGVDRSAAGDSSYAVHLSSCDGTLAFTNNVVYAGDGGNGTAGAAGEDGTNGVDGLPGEDAIDMDAAFGLDHGSTAHQLAGGAGGILVAGTTNVSGGDGGLRMPPDYDDSSGQMTPPPAGSAGESGANGGGNGGAAGYDVYQQAYSCSGYQMFGTTDGTDGSPGNPGDDGIGGIRAISAGTVSSGEWVPALAGFGATGEPGSGGGGGGSGGGAYSHSSCSTYNFGTDNVGPSGGGGGSGGAAGTGGGGGLSGAGSFGIFLTYSSPPLQIPVLSGNAITGGVGGDGGPGGPGGSGGIGGAGGSGGAAYPFMTNPVDVRYPSFPAGSGGDGGRGGHGGGGAGGSGGPSYCIYLHNGGGADASVWIDQNAFVPGSGGGGGGGGLSSGYPGEDGGQGIAATTNF